MKLTTSLLPEDTTSSLGARNKTPFVIVPASENTSDQKREGTSIVAEKFRKEERFTGKMGQDIHENIATYNETANDYQHGDNQKLRYFHNLLDCDGERFYRTIQDSCETYRQASANMISEYSIIPSQNRVRQHLQVLTLNTIMEKVSCDIIEGL